LIRSGRHVPLYIPQHTDAPRSHIATGESVPGYGRITASLVLAGALAALSYAFGLQPPKAWRTALWLAAAILVADFVVVFLYDRTLGPFDEGAVPEFWACHVPRLGKR
jgi:hypothetical protein